MPKVEVIVATMNQNDLSLYKKMNIETDFIIANQTNKFAYEEEAINGNRVRMVSTKTIGVGLNRNIGLALSDADIILFADDDSTYYEGYSDIVLNAFNDLPDADAIVFQTRPISNGQIKKPNFNKTQRLHSWNGLKFGALQIGIKRKALQKNQITFNQLFGGGCKYSSGEDSLFLLDCYRKKLRVYSYAALISENISDGSTWFEGYNEKFFYDKGAFAACAFHNVKFLICLYYLYVFRRHKELSKKKKLRLMLDGSKCYKDLITFNDYKKER